MILSSLTLLFLVSLAAVFALRRAVKNAKPGYQDATGFHFESPAPRMVVIEARRSSLRHEGRRVRSAA
jgi:hypothetical protein